MRAYNLIRVILGYINTALGYLGKNGMNAIAISIFLGLFLPGIAQALRLFLTPAIFILLTLSFVRVNNTAIASQLKHPKLAIAATLWQMIFLPALVALACWQIGLDQIDVGVLTALFMVSAAPPVMSTPIFIWMYGMNGALALTISTLALIAAPLTTAFFASMILPASLQVNPYDLALNLAGFLLGSALLGRFLYYALGAKRIDAATDQINGLNCIVLFVFAVAAMDGVADFAWTSPFKAAALFLTVFSIATVQFLLTYLSFLSAGVQNAFIASYGVASRNLGLMVAALGGTVPELAWLFFAFAQFPIYLLPWILRPLALRAKAAENRQT
ncbi:symporter [Pseudovibrio sp. Tun.PSC04-5.I4]|uniref:symporter n=1 Tax=Pseudovibrio sp. Tun.PSC04-5.I4 TaxID=1798213 RepID=UPI00088C1788|nr:symporter [Pseudovibrio sp. Tun.PSC04-5.I4]SDR37523.1 bile acid:Na+ symporter, BASS family [Pseudovibrio sp. Tun.PSC04-5.I4]